MDINKWISDENSFQTRSMKSGISSSQGILPFERSCNIIFIIIGAKKLKGSEMILNLSQLSEFAKHLQKNPKVNNGI